MPVFIALVVIAIGGIMYIRRQKAKPRPSTEEYSPYAMEQPVKKKGDLGGAFVFVIGLIIVIAVGIVVIPKVLDKQKENKAVEDAKTHLSIFGMSYSGLVDQLVYEGYTQEQAQYGASNCGADWNEQAVAAAKQHLAVMPMSRKALIDQLIYEGFTQEQAEYAANTVGS